MLWDNGIPTEIVSCRDVIMKEQIINVMSRGIPYMVLVAETEFAKGCVKVKDLKANKQIDVKIVDAANYIASL